MSFFEELQKLPPEMKKKLLGLTEDTNDKWEPPTPLGAYNLPKFPVDVFTPWLREFIEAIAEATQTPLDLAAMIVLPVCATSVSGKYAIQLKPGWKEPLNLFTTVVMGPGERKSAVFSSCVKPIEEFERKEGEKLIPEITKAKNELKILEERLKYEQNKASKEDGEKAKELTATANETAKLIDEYSIPKSPRIIADDVSPEKLANLLFEYGGKFAVLSPEGGIFEIMAGRYSPSSNLEVFLKGHSGDTLRVDRINRSAEYIYNPCLTLGLAIQPDVLRGLINKKEFRGRGLLARFLYSLPSSLVGNREPNSLLVCSEIENRYKECIITLLEKSCGNTEKSIYLHLSPEAAVLSNNFASLLEPKLAPLEELHLIVDWASKLHGAIGRIAGILHLTAHVYRQSPEAIPISGDTFQAAIKVGEYLIEHAKVAFAEMGADENIEKAKYVLQWIKKNNLEEFSRRDAHYNMQRKFKKVTELDPVIEILINYGYLRCKVNHFNSKNASPVFEVNPMMTEMTMMTESCFHYNSVTGVNSVNTNESSSLKEVII